MKRYYRHIALWLCLPTLLLSTVGVSFHTLYCLCKGETQVSLFFIPDQCAALEAQTPKTCCAKEKACAKPVTTNAPACKDHPGGCSTHGVQFAKLDTPFLSAAGDYQKASNFQAIAPPQIFPSFQLLLEIRLNDLVLPNGHSPPSGMELRRFLKSYRC